MHSEKTIHDKFVKIGECCRKVRRVQQAMREVSQAIEAEPTRGAPITTKSGASPIVPPQRRT